VTFYSHLLHFFHLFSYHEILDWIEAGGYGVVFALLFLCGLGLPVPEDVPLIISGILISTGHMHVWIVAPIAWCGIIGGDSVLYLISYKLGRAITKVPMIGTHVPLARLQRAEVLFERYGILVVGVGRMLAGIRGAMVIAAGVTRFPFWKFIIVDGVAAIVSGGIFMALGWWCGTNKNMLERLASEFRLVIIVVAALTLIGLAIWIYWKGRKEKKQAIVMISHEPHGPGSTPPGESVTYPKVIEPEAHKTDSPATPASEPNNSTPETPAPKANAPETPAPENPASTPPLANPEPPK